MGSSLKFYLEGLGFEITKKWVVDGRIRWCWLKHGGASLMLQEFLKDRVPSGKLGEGVSVCFQCKDALAIYHQAKERGLAVRKPFVGNAYWVTGLTDPDGYQVIFESPTDVTEETEYSE
jgi:lactoylglutathione lyase